MATPSVLKASYELNNIAEFNYLQSLLSENKLQLLNVRTMSPYENSKELIVVDVEGEEVYLKFTKFLFLKFRKKLNQFLKQTEKVNNGTK